MSPTKLQSLTPSLPSPAAAGTWVGLKCLSPELRGLGISFRAGTPELERFSLYHLDWDFVTAFCHLYATDHWLVEKNLGMPGSRVLSADNGLA